MAKDMLFATLDPTMRRVQIPDGPEVILSDTVGFISDLPTELVAAFRATLEEVLAADVVLHVRDISHAESEHQAEDVEAILASLGVEDNRARIEVWNKLDQLPEDEAEARRQRAAREEGIHAISALTGEGLDDLLRDIAEKLQGVRHEEVLNLSFAEGKQRAWLFKEDLVQKEEQTDSGFEVTVLWTDRQKARYRKL
jgi:GTP-binding protein HflX